MKKELEFNEIIFDILKNDKFISLKYEKHHGISRLEHSLNVAKMAYYFSKIIGLKKYKEITRAALLHDFYNDSELEGEISLINHPKVAADNAKKVFNVSSFEYNMIKSHMFPLTFCLPNNYGSLILTLTDKIVATYEMLMYKLPLYTGTYYLLLTKILLK
ncbi:MAG: HD domain-containing protein [bacterium]